MRTTPSQQPPELSQSNDCPCAVCGPAKRPDVLRQMPRSTPYERPLSRSLSRSLPLAVSLTARASSDQWDRAPYITTIGLHAPKPSVFPKFREIHHNFMLANYNSQEAVRRSAAAASVPSALMCRLISLMCVQIDNDDGSSYCTQHTYIACCCGSDSTVLCVR